MPPLHLPAEGKRKREENPLWIGVVLFFSAFLSCLDLWALLYIDASVSWRGSAPLFQSKLFENEWGVCVCFWGGDSVKKDGNMGYNVEEQKEG